MRPLRVAIADDHPVIITAFKAMIAAEQDLEFAGAFGDGAAAIASVAQGHTDVLVLDLSLPAKDGVSVIAALQQLASPVRVVVWTAGFDPGDVLRAVQQGAHAVALKQMPPEYVVRCIRRVGGARGVDTESIRRSLDMIQKNVGQPPDGSFAKLSPRELEVVAMVAQGLRNAEIAGRLRLSVETVKTHLQNTYAKLGIGTRVELSLYAKEKGLI